MTGKARRLAVLVYIKSDILWAFKRPVDSDYSPYSNRIMTNLLLKLQAEFSIK